MIAQAAWFCSQTTRICASRPCSTAFRPAMPARCPPAPSTSSPSSTPRSLVKSWNMHSSVNLPPRPPCGEGRRQPQYQQQQQTTAVNKSSIELRTRPPAGWPGHIQIRASQYLSAPCVYVVATRPCMRCTTNDGIPNRAHKSSKGKRRKVPCDNN